MFGFSPKRENELSPEEYRAEFKRLTNHLWTQHEVDATPRDELLHAMAVLENEVIEQLGANWDEDDQGYYLNLVRDRLLAEPEADRAQIEMAAETVRRFGEESAESGKSNVQPNDAVALLIARVIDWLRAHPE